MFELDFEAERQEKRQLIGVAVNSMVDLAEISAKISVELRTFAVITEWRLTAIQRNLLGVERI